MLIRIDADDPRPLFEQVAASVRSDILGGALSTGDRLPSAREVSETLEINLHTVLHAYQQLRDEGLIDLRRGRGAVVAATPLAEISDDITALVKRGASLGLTPETLAALVKEANA